MSGPGDNSGAELRSIVERVERLDEEIKDLNADKRDIFAEAKSRGYDVKAIKKVIQLRRVDPAERTEFEAIVDTYMSALGMASRVHVHAREESPPHDPETGEIDEPVTPDPNSAEDGPEPHGADSPEAVHSPAVSGQPVDDPDLPPFLDRRAG